jgi:hypothetical protein
MIKALIIWLSKIIKGGSGVWGHYSNGSACNIKKKKMLN